MISHQISCHDFTMYTTNLLRFNNIPLKDLYLLTWKLGLVSSVQGIVGIFKLVMKPEGHLPPPPKANYK